MPEEVEPKINWKKFGFKLSYKVLEAVKEDLVSSTASSWDDTVVDVVTMALKALEDKFVPDEVPAVTA